MISAIHKPSSTTFMGKLGKAVVPLVASDVVLQGCRYALVACLGYLSFSLLGSYLLGSALGALATVAIDFGINQHWLRLESGIGGLTRQSFTRVLAVKLSLSFAQILALAGVIESGMWNRPFPMMMATGLTIANLHALVDTCEAVGFVCHRHRLVALMRVVLGLVLYAAPVSAVFLAGGAADSLMQDMLQGGLFGGMLILSGYAWAASRMLLDAPEFSEGCLSAWRASRWLGLNQLGIVVDVRAPLVILGLMLGEAAAGLYGLVQRTTAVVELAWASISKLLLKSYAEVASARGGQLVHQHILYASWVTGAIMLFGMTAVWFGVRYLERLDRWSQDILTGLELLRWATVAIGLSSLKRPLVLGLIALHRERAVCAINVLSAAVGLVSVPLLIWSFGIWGPIVAAVVCEMGALLLLVSSFRAAWRDEEAEDEVASRWLSRGTERSRHSR